MGDIIDLHERNPQAHKDGTVLRWLAERDAKYRRYGHWAAIELHYRRVMRGLVPSQVPRQEPPTSAS